MKRKVPIALVVVGGLLVGAYASTRPRNLRWRNDEQVAFHNAAFDVVHTGELTAASLATVSKGALWVGEGRFVFRADGIGAAFGPEHKLFQPPAQSLTARLRDVVASARAVRHFRKLDAPTNAVVLRTGTLLVLYDRMYRSTDGGDVFELVPSLPRSAAVPDMYGMSEATPRNEVYYGELTFQPQPHPVRIYKGSDDGRHWEVKHTFPAGVTGHVHGIVYDSFRDRLWIGTGDDDGESKLFYTDDDFRSVHVLGEGDQGWRIVGLIPTNDALFWGSDGEPDGANIYRYDFSTGQRSRIQHVGNPVWFATRLADGTMVLASAYEPAIPYTKRHSPPREAALWISRDGAVWEKTVTFPYRSDVRIGVNAVLGLSRANAHRTELYVSPFGPIEKSLTVQRYEVRWHSPAAGGPAP